MLATIVACVLVFASTATAQYRYASSIPSAERHHMQQLCVALADVRRAMNADEVVETDLAASLAHATAVIQTIQPGWQVEIARVARSSQVVIHLVGPDDYMPLFNDPPPNRGTVVSKFAVQADGENWIFRSTVVMKDSNAMCDRTTIALREEQVLIRTEDAMVFARYLECGTRLFPFLVTWKGLR